MDTDKDEAILMALGGMSIDSIAEELQVSSPTVYSWLLNSNISAQLKRYRDKSIITMYQEEEQPLHDICLQAQVSIGTVYRVLHKHGVELRRTTPAQSDDVDDLIVAAYMAGETLARVRLMSKRSLAYIYKVLDQRRIPRRR